MTTGSSKAPAGTSPSTPTGHLPGPPPAGRQYTTEPTRYPIWYSTPGYLLPFNDLMRIVPMTAAYAAEIVTWRYPPPYDVYDMSGDDAATLTSADGGFFALTSQNELIGFRSFGADGQVPGGAYDAAALDTGGGLRPDLTGKGLGREAIRTGLAFGREKFAPAAFRVTIATFNIRAQRVVQALGFRRIARFHATADGRSYEMLTRPEQPENRPSSPANGL
jgi:ribosomal-protein-alanine N-acetyltransferase